MGGLPDDDPVQKSEKRLKEFYTAMVTALMERDDSNFLGEAFLTELLDRCIQRNDINRDPQALAFLTMISVLKKAIAIQEDNLPNTLFRDTFGIDDKDAIAQAAFFFQTGILSPAKADVHITLLLALIERTSELTITSAKEYLIFFERLISFSEAGVYTSEHSDFPDVRHQRIALLYAAMPDPRATWLNTWRLLSGVRYKLRCSLFDAQASEWRAVLNFMLACGLSTCTLLSEGGEHSEARALHDSVTQKLASYSQWDWIQEHFFVKFQQVSGKIGEAIAKTCD